MTIRTINDNFDYKCTYSNTLFFLIEKHYCNLELLELLLGLLLLQYITIYVFTSFHNIDR